MKALLLTLAVGAASAAPAGSGSGLDALDVIELNICYTTMMARYYKPVTGAQLLGGARTGMIAYLRSRGIGAPALPLVPAKIDRWRAEDELTRYVAISLLEYGNRVEPEQLVQAACAGQLSSVNDPYTILFHPQEYKGFNTYLNGEQFGGIGVIFAALEAGQSRFANGAAIAQVIPGSPAERAGLAAGDAIVSIDGREIANMNPAGVQNLVRGKAGTQVTLGVARDGAVKTVTLARAEIATQDVFYRMLPSNVGYIALGNFGGDSAKQFRLALEALRAAHARAYVIDLRNNGGGYRDASVEIASHFVSGTVVTVKERLGAPVALQAKNVLRVSEPVAVLVNGDTASGSEIVAGAIQDAKRGSIVGERTFGKGLVQEVYPLPDGAALKVTTARYFTPAGRDIDRSGIQPDLAVSQPKDAVAGTPGRDPQLDAALKLLAGPSDGA